MKRILIFGNSGSGKSTKAKELSSKYNISHFDLDKIFWKCEGRNIKREKEIVYKDVKKLASLDSWIIEGVYGDLLEIAIDLATEIIFLDLSPEEIKRNLLKRGKKSASDESFNKLLTWADEYWGRDSKSSYQYHLYLYNLFNKKKSKLKSDVAINKKDV